MWEFPRRAPEVPIGQEIIRIGQRIHQPKVGTETVTIPIAVYALAPPYKPSKHLKPPQFHLKTAFWNIFLLKITVWLAYICFSFWPGINRPRPWHAYLSFSCAATLINILFYQDGLNTMRGEGCIADLRHRHSYFKSASGSEMGKITCNMI